MKIKFVLLTLLFILTAPVISSGAQKIITNYKTDSMIGVLQPAPSTITFDQNLADFTAIFPTGTNAVLKNSDNTVNLGNGVATSCGVLWYAGNSALANCAGGKCNFDTGFRAYFEFTSLTTDTQASSTTYGNGFTFTVMNGANNDNTKRGGSPTGAVLPELMCYAGSGNTSSTSTAPLANAPLDGLGLEPPKMAIEFDTYPNTGASSYAGCSTGRADGTTYNHTALMFWGANPASATMCSVFSTIGSSYPQASYDDNIHGAGTTGSSTVPRNSYSGDGTGGYCQRLNGKVGSYNWMEDGQLHRVRIEVKRATTAATLGCAANTYAYNVKAWVDCEGGATCCSSGGACNPCPANEYVYFQDVFNDYTNASYLPKINRTVCLSSTLHGNFSTMLFGFTQATGTLATAQNIQIKNFVIYFPSGYTWCAYEDPTPGAPGPFYCSFSGTRTVAYGANGFYNYMYNATSPVHCNNATFNDPIVGTLKNCYYK